VLSPPTATNSRSGQIALPVPAQRGVIDAGLMAIRSRIGRVGLDAEVVVFSEEAECAGTGAGTALRADGGGLLPTGIGEIAIETRRRITRTSLRERRTRKRQARQGGEHNNSVSHFYSPVCGGGAQVHCFSRAA